MAVLCAGVLLLRPVPTNAAEEFPPLNDPPTTARLEGKFIWADLFTTDPSAAARFYEGLFQWTSRSFSRDGRTYFLLEHEGSPVAGIVQRPVRTAGSPPGRWVGYLAVTDVARTLGLVTKTGGRVLAPARDFPRRGTQAIFADPEGTVLGLLHSLSGDPPDYQAEHGDWIWAELFAKAPERAVKFYQDVFGYTITVAPSAEKKDRFVLAAGGYARAGIAQLPAQEGGPPAWLGIVRVANTDDAAARATALGGRVQVTPRPSPLGHRYAIIADPTGAAVGIIEFNPSSRPNSP